MLMELPECTKKKDLLRMLSDRYQQDLMEIHFQCIEYWHLQLILPQILQKIQKIEIDSYLQAVEHEDEHDDEEDDPNEQTFDLPSITSKLAALRTSDQLNTSYNYSLVDDLQIDWLSRESFDMNLLPSLFPSL